MRRFMMLRWTPDDHEMRRRVTHVLAPWIDSGAWRQAFGWRGVTAVVPAATPETAVQALPCETGVVIGALYEGGDGAQASKPLTLERREAYALADAGGDALFARAWGAYVAVLADHGRDLIHVLRDPMGGQACFLARWERVWVVCSHPGDLIALGWHAAPDLEHVAGFLARPNLSTRSTGLVGLRTVHPGERITLPRHGLSHAQLWSPRGAGERRDGAALSFADAAARVRETALSCAGAWAHGATRIAHRLSGGLDSSAVLGCLRAAAPDCEIIAACEFTPGAAEADERPWARRAAAHAGCRLIEIEMRPDAVTYERALDAPLAAAPSLSLLSFGDGAYLSRMDAIGADLITSGQGGDHIFQRNRPPHLAADALCDGLSRAAVFAVARDVAHLSGHSLWRVGADVAVHGWLRRPWDHARHIAGRNPLQCAAPAGALEDYATHPWLMDLPLLSPARAQRAFHLLDAVHYHDASALNAGRMCAPVLLSQPLVELCLRIAPYRMVEGGRERALARAAFAPLAPAEIIARTLKGETTRYFNAVLEHNLAFMRDLLLAGVLLKDGLIDRRRTEAALTREGLADGATAHAVLCCLAAELWRGAVERARGAAPAGSAQSP